MIKKLTICGLRSFGKEQTIKFSIPDKEKNESGLNIVIGPNNSGKTTIIEAIKAFNSGTSPTFSEGKRNKSNGNIIHITLEDENDKNIEITTIGAGGSETIKEPKDTGFFYIVPSRRNIDQEFRKGAADRKQYIEYYQKNENNRSHSLNNFSLRIFEIIKYKDKFDELLKKVMGYSFDWTVEQRDNGQYYIKCINSGLEHSGEGIGDGIWGLFTICASLFDSREKDTIVIDEPELSLHPMFQKRLIKIIKEYAQDRQIILCTHSAHFVDWDEILDRKASLIRVIKEDTESIVYKLSKETIDKLNSCKNDLNNPHLFGMEASEALFADDRMIVCEGQEDIIGYRKIANQINIEIKGEFYGWGSGGASKISIFLSMLFDLGFKHVVAIFDGDKQAEAEKCQKEFPKYTILVLETDDIRDKDSFESNSKIGVVNKGFVLKDEYVEYATTFIKTINESLE